MTLKKRKINYLKTKIISFIIKNIFLLIVILISKYDTCTSLSEVLFNRNSCGYMFDISFTKSVLFRINRLSMYLTVKLNLIVPYHNLISLNSSYNYTHNKISINSLTMVHNQYPYSTRHKNLSIPPCLTTIDIVWSRPLCDRCVTIVVPLRDRCCTVA